MITERENFLIKKLLFQESLFKASYSLVEIPFFKESQPKTKFYLKCISWPQEGLRLSGSREIEAFADSLFGGDLHLGEECVVCWVRAQTPDMFSVVTVAFSRPFFDQESEHLFTGCAYVHLKSPEYLLIIQTTQKYISTG